ncbi:21 kDa protein [Spatholobus suberectus]|nr:21 kDa protein [Spatholobus suberectus]
MSLLLNLSNRSRKSSFSLPVSSQPLTKMGKGSLFLLLSALHIACAVVASPTNFIKSSCSATQYPALCVESLSVYASSIQQDPQQLVQTALSLSLNRTESTKAFVTKCNKFRGLKPREYAALKDCAEEISDSVDRLSRSLKELKLCKAKGEDFAWHISNVETWVSAALTDESTCGDGFAGKALNGKIKASIRARMLNVAQVTSNALSLINQYAAKH